MTRNRKAVLYRADGWKKEIALPTGKIPRVFQIPYLDTGSDFFNSIAPHGKLRECIKFKIFLIMGEKEDGMPVYREML